MSSAMKKWLAVLTAVVVGTALNGASVFASSAHAWWSYTGWIVWRGGW
jgi:hypothetical protein